MSVVCHSILWGGEGWCITHTDVINASQENGGQSGEFCEGHTGGRRNFDWTFLEPSEFCTCSMYSKLKKNFKKKMIPEEEILSFG